jgi:ketosteroid isomerase-like protein
MKRYLLVLTSLVAMLTLLPSATLFGQDSTSSAEATITKMENDAVKADLSDDASFYQKELADDWTGGTSRGTWETKDSVLADMKDTKNNHTNNEQISDLHVRIDGDVAVATYKTTYDAVIHGQPMARTVISTDVFHLDNGTWKQISSHSSVISK